MSSLEYIPLRDKYRCVRSNPNLGDNNYKRRLYIFWQRDLIDLYLGPSVNWGPCAEEIRSLFWKPNLKYLDRFKLAAFVFNNPIPRRVFLKWIVIIGTCRDKSAYNHIISLFQDWDNGKNITKYYSFCITSQKVCYLDGKPKY